MPKKYVKIMLPGHTTFQKIPANKEALEYEKKKVYRPFKVRRKK